MLMDNGIEVLSVFPCRRGTAATVEAAADDTNSPSKAPVRAYEDAQPRVSAVVEEVMQECVSVAQKEPYDDVHQQVAPYDEAHVVEARGACDLIRHAMDGSRKNLGPGGSQDGPRDTDGARTDPNCALSAPSVATDPAIVEADKLPPVSPAQQATPATVIYRRPPAPAGLMWSFGGVLRLLPHFELHEGRSRVPSDGGKNACYVVYGGRRLDEPGFFH